MMTNQQCEGSNDNKSKYVHTVCINYHMKVAKMENNYLKKVAWWLSNR